jgi:DNA polymerase-3 subunit alpha (Gram-positive type)
LKLDILGHDDPTTIKMLEDLTGIKATDIPLHDDKVLSLFTSTEALGVRPEDIDSTTGTLGLPETGTDFVRGVLIDTQPKMVSDLIRVMGLTHGTDVWLNNAQKLILENGLTLQEVICNRDDIMNYLIKAGLEPFHAFDIMEKVRKGKGLTEKQEALMREKDVPEWYIDSCKKIKYMFPKAHAAAYAMMALRIGWFKVYRPVAFYTAYFSVRGEDFDANIMTRGKDKAKAIYLELKKRNGNELSQKEKNILTLLALVIEMYERGIEMLPVDIYKSEALRFTMEEGKIRPSLNSLSGLGNNAALSIAEARKKGSFKSVEDLRLSAKVGKNVIEILRDYGCLDGMPGDNQMTIF